MSKNTRALSLLCAAACTALAATTAIAQTAANYPNKPVRIILPYAPGGGTSISTRIFSDYLSKEMGQSFVVDNRPGGNTIIGTAAAGVAPADGYNLLVATNSLTVLHWTTANLPFDVLKDFVGVSTTIRNDEMIAIHPSVPVNNFKEFIAYTKANPGKINARIQVGTSSHVAHVLFMDATGAELTLVPYKGSGSATNDLLAGIIQFTMTTPANLIQHIKAGKMKGLTISNKRHPALPEMPTFIEAGLTNFEGATSWHMVLAPAKAPRDIIEKLNGAIGKAQANKEVQDLIFKAGVEPYPLNVTATNNLIRSDIETIGKVVRKYNIKAEAP